MIYMEIAKQGCAIMIFNQDKHTIESCTTWHVLVT